jgi:hypothetical protein
MKTKRTPKQKSRITRITVARLYNIGNYEHIRYELTAEVPEGCSAKAAMGNLVKIIRNANPKAPCTRSELLAARESISKPLAKMINSDHVNAKYYRNIIDNFEKWQKGREEALRLLEKFGGKSDHKDAKLDWEDTPW